MGKRKVFTDDNGYLVHRTGPGSYAPITRDQMPDSKIPKVQYGSGAPSSTPEKIGDIYIDTSNKVAYIAQGTSSSSDWATVDTDATAVLAALVTTGSGAPNAAPTKVGLFYIDTTGWEIYQSYDTQAVSDWVRLQQAVIPREGMTASGAVGASTRFLELNHVSTPIAATIAAAPINERMFIKNISASGTAAHTVTLSSGTWDGTNTVATLDAPGEAFEVIFDSNGNGTILSNTGVVTFA